MIRRTFQIQKHKDDSRGGAILDIPHPAILKYATPLNLVTEFERAWGTKPEAVVLPVTAPDGLLFQVEGLGEPLSAFSSSFQGQIRDFQDIVDAFSRMGIGIYLLLDITLPFIKTSALHLVDIVGDSSAQVCIGNPRLQDVAAAILGTGVDITLETTKMTPGKLHGIVIDVVDILPMGGKEERLELTCFCPSCEGFFSENKPDLLRSFKTSPNPWNLLLRSTNTGIEHTHQIRKNYIAEDLVGLSRQKAFHTVYGEKAQQGYLETQANVLLEYIKIRHLQVVSSIANIFEQALHGLDSQPTRVILTEGFYYDWTSGLQLERLDEIPTKQNVVPYDEIWFNPPSGNLSLEHVPFRSYMWDRSRYFLDAFFHLAALAGDPVKRSTMGIARYSPARIKALLNQRLNQAMGAAITGLTSLSTLPSMKGENDKGQRVGFIGGALTKDIGERFIEGIQVVPIYIDRDDIDENSIAEVLRNMLESDRGSKKGE